MAATKKYTWIIGDVHGMFDHLNYLLKFLNTHQSEKYIFLGDLIDRGPSSKQVIDRIMNLPEEVICLLGNHEHMMLDEVYMEKTSLVLPRYLWEFNGGDKTINSFGYKDITEFREKLPQKYHDFFKNMQITHEHKIELGKKNLKFLCAHAGFYPYKPLNEQLSFRNYSDFSAHYSKKGNDHSHSPVWVRNSFFDAAPDVFEKNIIIHGHTPTQKLRYFCTLPPSEEEDYFSKLDTKVYIPDLPYIRKEENSEKIISIDIDTGVAAGRRLTAIGICEDNYEENEKGQFLRLEFVQIDASKGFGNNSIKLFDYMLDISENAL